MAPFTLFPVAPLYPLPCSLTVLLPFTLLTAPPCHLPFPLARPLWTPPLFMLHIFRCLLMTAKMRFGRRERERERKGGGRGAGNALRTFAVPLAAAGAANFPRTHNFMQIVFVARWQSSAPSPTLCVCAFLVHTLWRRTRLHANMQHDVIRGSSKKFNSLYLLGPISCCATKGSASLPPLSLSLPCLLMHTQISFS